MKLLIQCLLVLLFYLASAGRVYAALTIEISQGVDSALPIAVAPFDTSKVSGRFAVDLADIISKDLNRSGVLKVLVRDLLPARPHYSQQVDYRQWKSAGQDYLVIGRVLETSAGVYNVQFQLLDILKKKQLIGYKLPVKQDSPRSVAHEISDLIYEKITGTPGAFNTRIAYIRVQPGQTKLYTLQVADTDGFNAQTVLESSEPLMSPSWSPDGQSLTYVSFENKRPEIFIQHLATAQRRRISAFNGINGAPSWSADGKNLALVLSKDGGADIYVMNIANKQLRRLTHHRSIDTEPVWTEDDQAIIFTSNRGGQPQLYEIAVENGKPRRLTFEGPYNSAATLSADGQYMAMVHGEHGGYRIARLERQTGNLIVLTDGSLDESPSFSPNGKFVVYASKRGDRSVLHVVSVDGLSKYQISDQAGDIRDPVWGPYKPRR